MEQIEVCRYRSDYYHDAALHMEFIRGNRDCRLFFRVIYGYLIGLFLWFFWQMIIQLREPEAYAKSALFMVFVVALMEGLWALLNRGGGVHYKRSLMLSGGKPTNDSVLFCEDQILAVTQETGNKNTISYENIRYVQETPNLLLLGLRYSTCLIVDKRGLNCSKEELGRFLYEKCPKLRGKKVGKTKWGILLRKTAWVVVLASFLVALYFHPWLQINKRVQGQIHNGMSLTKISKELEGFGLTPLDAEALESSDLGFFYLNNNKLEHLLYCMGAGDRDYDTGSFTPAESGVFFCYYWSDYPQTMYADFFSGIGAMSHGELTFEQIQEAVDLHNGDGVVRVDFLLNGKPMYLEPVYYGDWYDEQCYNTLNDMIRKETGKQLYFVDFQDTGCFIFLGDEAWAERFARRTGLEISSDINDIYY